MCYGARTAVFPAAAETATANTAANVVPLTHQIISLFFLLVSVKIIGSFVQKFYEKEGVRWGCGGGVAPGA